MGIGFVDNPSKSLHKGNSERCRFCASARSPEEKAFSIALTSLGTIFPTTDTTPIALPVNARGIVEVAVVSRTKRPQLDELALENRLIVEGHSSLPADWLALRLSQPQEFRIATPIGRREHEFRERRDEKALEIALAFHASFPAAGGEIALPLKTSSPKIDSR